MKILSFKVTEAMDRMLLALVKRRSVHKSMVVREALARYLGDSSDARGGSLLEAACDLVGCVKDAPTNLSSNPRRLDDFGR